ncbi:MAG: ATP-binding protein [Candidatus Hodarchaeota archaeon]
MYKIPKEIQEIRDCQLTWGIRAFAVLGFLALIASLSRAFYVGWQNIMYLHIGLYLLIIGTAILNQKLSFLLRAWILIGTVFVLGVAGLASWGLAGFGMFALFALCIISTMLFGARAGILSAIISIFVVCIIGIAVNQGFLTFKFNPVIYLHSLGAWATGVITIVISAGLIVMALGTMNNQLFEIIGALNEKNSSLLDANKKLEDEIKERKRLEKERRQLETKLQRAEKMEIVATLAGGVAHDLNNILAGAVSYPELMLMQVPEDSPLRNLLEITQKSGLKAAAIVNDLLTLVRRGVATAEVTNLNFIISEYLTSPEFEKLKSFHPKVDIEIHLEENLLNTLASPVHLMKTLMNLVSNAAEAMQEGGKLSIHTQNCNITQPIMVYDGAITKGEYAVLKVSDTGTGMSSETIERIFEPFYTKKVMGRSGTGLGMSVVWGTVKDYKGHIDIQSTEGEGTTFILYFPANRKEMPIKKSELSVIDYKGSGESVVVIDDVREQREVAVALLTSLGYSASSFPSGEKALDYLKGHASDLVLLNMIMDPGMDGLDTYREILKIHPVQKAIIISGFSETERVKEAKKLGAGQYLMKPFTLENLGIAVKTELEK